MFVAPLAMLLKFELSLDRLSVFVRMIIHVLAHGASQADYVFGKFSLSHMK